MGGLQDEDRRSALIALAQFVLRREAVEIREDLHKNVVETAVFLGTQDDSYLSLTDLDDIMQKKLFGVRLPSSLMGQTVDSLEKENRIEKSPESRIRITSHRKTQIRQQMQEQESLTTRVEKEITDAVTREYSHLTKRTPTPSQLAESNQVFYSFLSNLVRGKGNLVAGILSGSQQLGSIIVPSVILRKCVSELDDTDLRGSVIRAIENLLSKASSDLTRYVMTICQNFICLQTLNMDPLCQKLEKELWWGWLAPHLDRLEQIRLELREIEKRRRQERQLRDLLVTRAARTQTTTT